MYFSDVTDIYSVMKMPLDRYGGTSRVLEEGFSIAGENVREKIYKQEKKSLKLNFKAWKAPFYGRLPGWRHDSPIYIMCGDLLAGGCYICDKNEFGEPDWGQMHYNHIVHDFIGKGLFSLLFNEVMAKAYLWGLCGIIINTDRFLHPDLYQRWGAFLWKTIPKKKR